MEASEAGEGSERVHPAIRAAILFVGALLAESTPLALYATIDHRLPADFPLRESLEVLDVVRIAAVATLASFMLPAAYYGANGGEWGRHPETELLMVTSLVTLPLMVVFPADEHARRAVYMSRETPLWSFFLLWWVHGATNATHVRMLRRRAGLLPEQR